MALARHRSYRRGAARGVFLGAAAIAFGFVLMGIGGWGPCGPASVLAEIGGILTGVLIVWQVGVFCWPFYIALELGLFALVGARFLSPPPRRYWAILERRRHGRNRN